MGENVGSHGMKAELLLPCRAVCVRKVGVKHVDSTWTVVMEL